jgi:hypothetical protein
MTRAEKRTESGITDNHEKRGISYKIVHKQNDMQWLTINR